MANNLGTLVTDTVRPFSDQDTFPVAYSNEIQGGLKSVATLTDRNIIPAERLQQGTIVFVAETGFFYKYINTSWIQLSKSDIQLDQVDNTSDLNKPISIATKTALDQKVSYIEYVNGAKALGPYNASTNSPTLTATPDPALYDGDYYDITESGPLGFAGSNFTAGTISNKGDRLKKKGNQWYLVPLEFESFYSIISQTYFADTKPSVIAAGSVLTTPNSLTCYIAPAGSYTLPAGTITLSGNINLIFWDFENGWTYLQFTIAAITELQEKSIELSVSIDELRNYIEYTAPIRTDNYTASWTNTSNFKGYAFGYIPTIDTKIHKVDVFLQNVNASNRLELSVYSRPVANNTSTVSPGSLSGDVLLFSKTYLSSIFQNTSNLQTCTLDFDQFSVTPDYVYIFLIKARDVSTGYVSIGSGRFASSISQSERGWYVESNGTTVSALPGTDSIAKIIYTCANRIDKTDANVTANTSNIIGLEASVKYYKSILELARIATWGYSTFSGFDFGYIPTSSQTCRKVDLDLLGVNQNTSLVLSIYKRLVANATSTTPISTNSTPALTGDELVLTKSYLASQFQNIDTVQTCSFEFPEIIMNNSYVYIFRIQAINNFSVGRLGSGRLTTSLTQAERGFVANTTGVFTTLNSGDTVARKLYTFDLVSNKLQSQIDENKASINNIKYDKTLVDYSRIATWGYSTFSGFDFGFIPTVNTTIKRVDLDLLGVNQNEKLTLLAYRRDVSNASSTSTIGNLSNDTLLFSKDYLSSQFQNIDTVQTCQLFFDEIVVSTNYIYIFRLQAVAFGGAIGRVGSGRLLITATQGERGWYRNTAGSYLTLNNQDAVAKKIYTADYVTNKLTEDILLLTPQYDSYDDVLVNYSVSGLTLNLANTYLVSNKAKSILSTSSITFDATQSFTVTLTGVNLIYNSNQSAGVFASLALTDGTGNRVRNITNCIVKRNDNQAVLTEGVDYKLFSSDGRIAGVNSSVTSILVDVTFTYTTERVDIVCIDASSKSAIITQGTQRKYDAIEEIYRAQKPSNTNFKILDVIVRGSSISVLNTYKWQGIFKKGKESELIRDISFGKRQLKKTLAKLNKGQNIVLASYAHSIYANQSQQPSYTPNGPYRDRIEWFQMNYPSDFTSQLALYDTGDGAGLKHVRLSSMWHLKKHIEDTYGVSIEYQNYSIGGTNTTNTELNALYPARLTEIINRAPDLVFLNFAINEVSASYSYDNYTQIIAALKNVGSEVIVWAGIELTNAVFNMDRTALVKKSNQLKQVAFDTGCAYIPVMYFLDEDFLGIDSLSSCMQNLYNHPGVWEHKKYGEMLTMFF